MVSAILLAAGESTRMEGAFKPLLKWGKGTVIGACIRNLRASRLAEIIVVLGHREAEVRARLSGAGVEYVINPDYKLGMLSSIKTGWTQISPQTDAVLIALVDQPMVTTALVDRLIDAYEEGGRRIVLPAYQGKHGHPIILDRDFKTQIMQIPDDTPAGLKSLIDLYRDEILEVAVDSPAVIEDIDRPEDYERLSKGVEPLYEHHKWHP